MPADSGTLDEIFVVGIYRITAHTFSNYDNFGGEPKLLVIDCRALQVIDRKSRNNDEIINIFADNNAMLL